MIRKYARLDARPKTVMAIFRDVERWPSWMPTMQSLKMLERSDRRFLVEVRERLMGRVATRTLEIVFDDQGFVQTQTAGRLKRWKAVWRFSEPPVGGGTVASTQIEIDLGLMRFLIPTRTVQRMLDELHEQIISRAEARARRREAIRVSTVWSLVPGQKLSVRVYETPTELEVWFGERRFSLPAAE